MSLRTAAWLIYSIMALAVLLGVLGSLLFFLNDQPLTGDTWFTLAFLAFPIVGVVIVSHRPENPIGWMFCFLGLLNILSGFAHEYAFYALVTQPGALPGGRWVGWSLFWVAGIAWTLMFLAFLLFPTGRLPSPRWRPLAWVVVGSIFVLSVLTAFDPGQLLDIPVPNPTGIEQASGILAVIRSILFPILVVGIFAVAASVIVRFRRARGEERQQLKWFAYTVVFLVGSLFVGLLNTEVLQNRIIEFVAGISGIVTIAAVPTAIGIAILRYRLYEIDLIINRTLVYGALTVTLVTVYVGTIVALQGLLGSLTGQTSQLAIVASTLAVAALFQPLRRRIQGFIDRRFYRRKYDARKALEGFSAKLRDETDLGALSDELVGVVRETMQPAHVSLWLRPETSSKGKQPD
jgi:hypothetical protein